MLEILDEYPEARSVAERSLVIEDRHHDDPPSPFGGPSWSGWSPGEVPVSKPYVVTRLVSAGLLERTGSGKYPSWRLRHPEATREALRVSDETPVACLEDGPDIPADLFDVVVGLDEVKADLWRCLRANEPVDVLLIGGPGSAKSLLLSELGRIRDSREFDGGALSRAGFTDVMTSPVAPKYPLIDEIDKCAREDQSVLLLMLESRRIRVTKRGQQIDKLVDCRGVFAAGNTVATLRSELIDRFWVMFLPDYTPLQFATVCAGVLTKRHGVDPELARAIAAMCVGKTRSVRASIRIARLAKGSLTEAQAVARRMFR